MFAIRAIQDKEESIAAGLGQVFARLSVIRLPTGLTPGLDDERKPNRVRSVQPPPGAVGGTS
jgi:hypothetical protein